MLPDIATMSPMVDWSDFVREAPQIAEVFVRRHKATGNLCFLATLRSDGYPRISPMEPGIFEGRLILVGMPNTTKFRDLARDPRFSLHTATVDTHLADGDAKVWGEARDVQDPELHARFAEDLFEKSGFDLRGQTIRSVLCRRPCRRIVGRVPGRPADDHDLEAGRGRAKRAAELARRPLRCRDACATPHQHPDIRPAAGDVRRAVLRPCLRLCGHAAHGADGP